MDYGASSYRRFLSGDKEAFAEIVEVYRESLIFFLYRYVNNLDIAEDLAEDVFVEVLLHPKRYRFRCSLKTWLFAIGRNKAVDYVRKHVRMTFCDMEAMKEQADLHTLEETVLDNEEKRAMSRAFADLRGDYRQALHLIYFEEMTYAEAGRVMGRSRKQVENLVYRGKQALRQALRKEGSGA